MEAFNNICHYFLNDRASTHLSEMLVKTILETTVATFTALLIAYGAYTINRWQQHRETLNAVIAELQDIHRHLEANLRNIAALDFEKGVPRKLHLEKMKLPNFYVLTKQNLGEGMNHVRYRILLQSIVILRNLNLEIDEVSDAIYLRDPLARKFSSDLEKADMLELKCFLKDRTNLAIAKVTENLDELNKSNPILKNQTQPVQIMYHRSRVILSRARRKKPSR
jgi:hypothetical protein